jgi:hypothetical protein
MRTHATGYTQRFHSPPASAAWGGLGQHPRQSGAAQAHDIPRPLLPRLRGRWGRDVRGRRSARFSVRQLQQKRTEKASQRPGTWQSGGNGRDPSAGPLTWGSSTWGIERAAAKRGRRGGAVGRGRALLPVTLTPASLWTIEAHLYWAQDVLWVSPGLQSVH